VGIWQYAYFRKTPTLAASFIEANLDREEKEEKSSYRRKSSSSSLCYS
jgi:hypothetical protein